MHHDRVKVQPKKVKKGDKVEVKYQGLLSKSGANNLWCHYGYDGWNNKATIPMQHNPDGTFTCKIPAEGQTEINFCFKDAAENWDDNGGWNWNCEIASRGLLF